MALFYSKSTGGFYDDTIHSEVPQDAVAITGDLHKHLLNEQSNGKEIKGDDSGFPIVVERAKTEEDIVRERKDARNLEVSKITVTVGSNELDADEKSQERMARRITSLADGATSRWKRADNIWVDIKKEDLTEALVLATNEQTNIWEQSDK
jgi:hypothetical protein